MSQLPLLGMPKQDKDNIYEKLGISRDKSEYRFDIKKGESGISEVYMGAFFPKLTSGIRTKDNIWLTLEHSSLIDIFDIDFKILKDGEPIGYIDNEHRQDAFIFETQANINIPLHRLTDNVRQSQTKKHSRKAEYYMKYPKQSFHLTRHPNKVEAICSWAEDFVYLSAMKHKTSMMGEIKVWQCPRYLTCYGKIYEHTIEDWVLNKLYKSGFIS